VRGMGRGRGRDRGRRYFELGWPATKRPHLTAAAPVAVSSEQSSDLLERASLVLPLSLSSSASAPSYSAECCTCCPAQSSATTPAHGRASSRSAQGRSGQGGAAPDLGGAASARELLARSPRHTRPPEQPLTATAHTLRPPARRPRPVPPVVARPLRPHLALPPAPGSPALAVAPMGKAKSGKKQDNSKAVRPSSLALSTSARIFISVSSSSPSSSRSAGCQSRQEGQAGVQGGQDRHEADQQEEGQGAGQGRGVGGGRLPPLARGAPPEVGRGAQGHRCVLFSRTFWKRAQKS